jgi:uncharacterized membrane protein
MLMAIALVGLILRFWGLDSKPLWLDEVITALFALGRSYTEVPLDQTFAPTLLSELFQWRSGESCAQIASRLVTESSHPPVFFCLLYGWMGWLQGVTENWVWALRSLSALFGVGAIFAAYALGRVAFSPVTGLLTAALMAVSPFAVYLSQEARHYTMPMLVITIALMLLVQIQRGALQGKIHIWFWFAWAATNLLGLYIHYLTLLALVGQMSALGGWLWWQRRQVRNVSKHFALMGLAIAIIVLGYLPWLAIFLMHMTRPEGNWLRPYQPGLLDYLAPLGQLLVGWVSMVIALPIENQPRAIAILSAMLLGIFTLWFAREIFRGSQRAWQIAEQRPALILLTGIVVVVVLEFGAIVYILGKDITVVPRYNFIYYPALCTLLAAILTPDLNSCTQTLELNPQHSNPHPIPLPGEKPQTQNSTLKTHNFPTWAIALLIGFASSLVVISGGAFQKAYYPNRTAATLYAEPAQPLLVTISYRSLQEVALGLSFALEMEKLHRANPDPAPLEFAFLSSQEGNNQVWQALKDLVHPLALPLNLWIIANPSVRIRDFPEELRLYDPQGRDGRPRALCQLDPSQTHRLGFPYQMYHCQPQVR